MVELLMKFWVCFGLVFVCFVLFCFFETEFLCVTVLVPGIVFLKQSELKHTVLQVPYSSWTGRDSATATKEKVLLAARERLTAWGVSARNRKKYMDSRNRERSSQN